MREIKFRVYHKNYKAVYDVAAIDFESRCMTLKSSEFVIDDVYFDEIELMQYTGLKDKNGVEIYEGNVVYHEEGEFSYQGTVKEDCYLFYIDGVSDTYSFDDVSDTFHKNADLEIIGNIYENPELLN